MNDNFGNLNEAGENNNDANNEQLANFEVQETISNAKVGISKSLFFGNILNILGFGGNNDPSSMVEQLAAYRAGALNALENPSPANDNDNIIQNKEAA